jgi:hypothetical protein
MITNVQCRRKYDASFLRAHFGKKKAEWARQESYYRKSPTDEAFLLWGDLCGFDLAPPLEESLAAEWRSILPKELLYYLTEVSVEIFCSSYPVVLDLSRRSCPSAPDANDEACCHDQHPRFLIVGVQGGEYHDELDLRTGMVTCGNCDRQHVIASSFDEYLADTIESDDLVEAVRLRRCRYHGSFREGRSCLALRPCHSL